METFGDKKVDEPHQESYEPSTVAEITPRKGIDWQYLKHYFTSKEGWIGDYVRKIMLSLLYTNLTKNSRTISTSSRQISGP